MQLYTGASLANAAAAAVRETGACTAATALPVLGAGRANRYAHAGSALAADAATALIVGGGAGGANRLACRSQTISASAPAVARVVLQVASALAPAHATCTSVSFVTFARRSPGHVA